MSRFLKILFHICFALIVLGGVVWTVTALRFHLDGADLWTAPAVLAAAILGTVWLRFRSRRLSWLAFVATGIIVASWYQTITPQQDRDWAMDVSRGVKARVAGDLVTLSDIRDFNWISAQDANPRWISRGYDLSKLETIDMITSVWDSPDIAHLLVSFGFLGGDHIVFSAEIRREANESFNEIGGFFRQFELVLIGATERDIVKLRTNYRGEDVSVFPVELSPEQRRTMFLSFVDLAQDLEERPKFYNTLTANCTTVVYQLAKTLQPDLPLDWRVVMSGHLPEYMDSLGVLGGDGTVETRRSSAQISKVAQQLPAGVEYSDWIRQR
ncbi:DUF4105 domain-containing protein [Roseibium polysiphoniae]|uniref:Lnb N-terminal periplasmic domain-containing protein n=1 Tax=Roseibium polysiphoniae TaxID=2571221 RepID=UPI003298F2CE